MIKQKIKDIIKRNEKSKKTKANLPQINISNSQLVKLWTRAQSRRSIPDKFNVEVRNRKIKLN
jgi:hypothetical protein